MRVFVITIALWAAAAFGVQAQTSDLQSLESGIDARGWEAVGRLDIDGKGFCTGALIAPDIVLTAAHCMYDKTSDVPVDPSRIQFLAGLRGGRPEATRAVRNAVVHPSYRSGVEVTTDIIRYDVALLRLERPIRSSRIVPFEISSTVQRGTQIGVVSYAMDRANAPSLQETCNVLGHQNGVLFMDCDINFGASGAPVFRNESGVPRLVSVFSAMADVDGETVALGTDLATPLQALRDALDNERGLFSAPPATARVIGAGERTETGALFVRP